MHLRILFSLFTALMCTLAMAQGYTVVVSGHIMNCTPAIASGSVTIQTMQNTQPAQSVTVQLNENCYFHHTFTMSTAEGLFQVIGICMDGTAVMDSVFYIAEPNIVANVNIDLWCGGGMLLDCNGVPGGPAQPGTPCDDGDPNTFNDHWTADCECAGSDCLADFELSSSSPFTLEFTNLSIGTDLTYQWWLPLNGSSNDEEPAPFVFPQTNAYEIHDVCLVITGANCESWHCDTIYVDPNGGITFDQPVPWDCEGVLGGPAMPGTPCDDGDPDTEGDHWTTNCVCVGINPNPGYTVIIMGHISPCNPAIAGGSVTIQSVQNTQPPISFQVPLNENCYYHAQFTMSDPSGWFQVTGSCADGTAATNSGQYTINAFADSAIVVIDLDCGNTTVLDCEGVLNGPAMPGTPCDDNDPNTFNDHWSADCDCTGSTEPVECEAGFWVIQAYGNPNGEPEPIPFELWAWNLSIGNGDLQYLWDFGDGDTSSAAFPTHVYPGSGPYLLCLSIWDASGCTDTYCDSIAVDEDGMFGMMGGGNDRNVLTLHVQQSMPTSVSEAPSTEGIEVWPNPANELINIKLGEGIEGRTTVRIIDANGRLVRSMERTFGRNVNTITLPVADLDAGMYLIRIENNGTSSTHRFVREQ